MRRQIGYSLRGSGATDGDQKWQDSGASVLEFTVQWMRSFSFYASQIEDGPERLNVWQRNLYSETFNHAIDVPSNRFVSSKGTFPFFFVQIYFEEMRLIFVQMEIKLFEPSDARVGIPRHWFRLVFFVC